MSNAALVTGLVHQEKFTIQPRHTVPQIDAEWPGFRDMPAVLATAVMIGFMEQTCIQALRPYLKAGENTLGTGVDVSHLAPTLPNSEVTAIIELVEIDNRTLHFLVSCFDENGLIGKGRHTRAIIQIDRFLQKLKKK